ncbi:MAG: hypothetical protein ABH986_04150 [archaeon]
MKSPAKRTKARIKPSKQRYMLKLSPTDVRKVALRGKNRQSKINTINAFNRLIEDNLFYFLKRAPDGGISAEYSERLSEENATAAARKVLSVLLGVTPFLGPFEKESTLSRRLRGGLKQHERKGNFVYIDPKLETSVMAKELKVFKEVARSMGMENFEINQWLRGLKTPNEISANLKKQLRYFRWLLKAKKKKEIVVKQESWQKVKGVDGGIDVRVKLTEKGVVRESRTIIKVDAFGENPLMMVDSVILKPDGKLEFFSHKEEIEKKRDRF